MLDTLYSYCNDWILFVNVSNTKYRLSAHLIMIEKGRFTQTPRERRLCNLCHINVEDEYHFILKCPFLYKYRTLYNRKYYWHIPSMYKLVQLMATDNLNELGNLGIFLQRAETYRCIRNFCVL